MEGYIIAQSVPVPAHRDSMVSGCHPDISIILTEQTLIQYHSSELHIFGMNFQIINQLVLFPVITLSLYCEQDK